MAATPTPELRPMDIGDILDGTFRLYRARFVPFLTVALVAYVPYGLVMALIQALLLPAMRVGQPLPIGGGAPTSTMPFGAPDTGSLIVGGISVLLLAFVVFPLVQGALIQDISATYL